MCVCGSSGSLSAVAAPGVTPLTSPRPALPLGSAVDPRTTTHAARHLWD